MGEKERGREKERDREREREREREGERERDREGKAIYYSALQSACKPQRQSTPPRKKYTIPMRNDVHTQFLTC